MKIVKHVLLFGLSLFLFFTFSSISLANTTTSEVGISFTEEKEVRKENQQLLNTESCRTSSKLPQTGEHKDVSLLIIGWSLLILLLVSKKLRTKQGGRIMSLKMMTAVGLIGSGMLLGTSTAIAAPQDEVLGSADGKGGTSHGYINLTPGDTDIGTTAPTDPTIPSGATGNKGTLTLDHVVPLLFNSHKLEGKEQIYTSVVDQPNVQVTDKRGEEAGWNVQVSQTDFVDQIESTKILKGAKLVIPAGTLKELGNVSLAPTMTSVEVNTSPAMFMNAAVGSGAGTWTNFFDKDQIKLTVPAGNKKGEYMSTVTWSMMNAPA